MREAPCVTGTNYVITDGKLIFISTLTIKHTLPKDNYSKKKYIKSHFIWLDCFLCLFMRKHYDEKRMSFIEKLAD